MATYSGVTIVVIGNGFVVLEMSVTGNDTYNSLRLLQLLLPNCVCESLAIKHPLPLPTTHTWRILNY